MCASFKVSFSQWNKRLLWNSYGKSSPDFLNKFKWDVIVLEPQKDHIKM